VREICMLGLMWRELETELWEGLRHRHMAKAAGNSDSPSPKATAPVLDPTRNKRSGSSSPRFLNRRLRTVLPASGFVFFGLALLLRKRKEKVAIFLFS
jgi:hypothetical protein